MKCCVRNADLAAAARWPRAGRQGTWGLCVSCKVRGPGETRGAQRHVDSSVDELWAGQDLEEEDEQAWGTHCQAFMAR